MKARLHGFGQTEVKHAAPGIFLATRIFAAAAAVMAYSTGAVDQPATAQPSNEMRPLYVTPDDIAEGNRLVQTSCAACHGSTGISSIEGTPHLAGQRSPYLYLELKAYQSGLRGTSAMNDAVKFLSDDALVKVAAYFASLDPPLPATVATTPPLDPIEAGKKAAASCAGCHGDAGVTKTPGMPNLVGLDPQYLIATMKSYRSGHRKHEVMKAMVAGMSDADISHVALFYALQQPVRAQTAASGDAQAGKAAAAACAGCHGDQGVSGNPATPSLAGQDAQYFATALRDYKTGARDDEAMKGLAAGLDDAAIQNLSAYYAGVQPQALNLRKPLSTEEWVQRCDRCHGVNGNSTNPRFPALASQRADYLEKVLYAYKARTRRSPEMAAMSDGLTGDDIGNLAAYYARQKARAVVFVTVPEK
jgi:cytochrome c553